MTGGMTHRRKAALTALAALFGVSALVACGAGASAPDDSPSPTLEDSEQTPSEQLARAIGQDDAAAVSLLLTAGADPNANLSTVGTTFAVDIAVASRALSVFAALADHGADLDALSGSNVDTPVARAASMGDAEVVAALIEAGADPTVLPTRTSWGPTHYAGYNGDLEVLGALVDAGVDLDISDNDGYSALHFAAATGSLEAVRFLVEAGADPEAVADNGFTPADSAADRDQDNVLAYFAGLGIAPAN
jgi:ankyrin repeat protein